MSSKKNNWWKPKSLKDSERHFIDENDLDKLDVGNDFGSYKVMLATNDLEKSLIRSHNDITPSFHVKAIKRILGDFNPQKIYDIGCGLGYTAKEISKEYPCAEVFGVDISVDAIDFAKKNFPNCQFFAEAADPVNNPPSRRPENELEFNLSSTSFIEELSTAAPVVDTTRTM